MSKHSEGPWVSRTVEVHPDNPKNQKAAVWSKDGDCVAVCGGVIAPNEANARLIAAAPTLLEALKWAETHIAPPTLIRGQNDEYCEGYERMISAIKLAEGEL